jgi:hypothetical protein
MPTSFSPRRRVPSQDVPLAQVEEKKDEKRRCWNRQGKEAAMMAAMKAWFQFSKNMS